MIVIYGANAKEKRLVKKVEKAVYKSLGQLNFFKVEITIVDEDTIRAVNATQRQVDAVTDVLSFPYLDALSLPIAKDAFADEEFEGRYVLLGSIMICRKRAEEQSNEYGHSYEREISFLACHGFLHLLGYDHVQKTDEVIMTAKQAEIMSLVRQPR